MKWLGLLCGMLAFGVSATEAGATSYSGTFAGTTPAGWIDTRGIFGTANADLGNKPLSGTFTFDRADYVPNSSYPGPVDPEFDPNGAAATPGYSASVTVNGVTVNQPDTQSFYGPSLNYFYIGAWNASFYLEIDGNFAAKGVTPAQVASGLLPSLSMSGSEITNSALTIQAVPDGSLRDPRMEGVITSFSLTAVPAAVPEPATLALLGGGLLGLGVLRRRAGAKAAG